MTNAKIDEIMVRDYSAHFLGQLEDEEFPESGGKIRVYASRSQRFIVEVDPDRTAIVYSFHANLNDRQT